MWGGEDQLGVGRLERGERADVVLFRGTPVEHTERCHECGGEEVPGRFMACGACDLVNHRGCLPAGEVPQRRGSWHCKECLVRLEKEGERDLTLDEPLLRYLSHAESPGTAEGLRRVF